MCVLFFDLKISEFHRFCYPLHCWNSEKPVLVLQFVKTNDQTNNVIVYSAKQCHRLSILESF